MSYGSRSLMVDLTDDYDVSDDSNERDTSLIRQFFDLTMDSDDESEAIVIDSDYDSDSPKIEDVKDEDAKHTYQQQEFRPPSKKSRTSQELRNGPILYPFEVLDHWPEHDLQPGTSVELKGEGGKDGDFVRIQEIIVDSSKDHDNILLRGQLLRRAKYVGGVLGTARIGGQTIGGKMKRDLNELALLFDVDKDDPRPPEEQSLVTVSLSDVLCTRRIVFTHEAFPRRSFRETTTLNRQDPHHEILKQSVKETGILVCRYVFLEYYKDARQRLASKKRSREACLRRIFMTESDFPTSRSEQVSQGDNQARRRDEQQSEPSRRVKNAVKKRKITYGSGFCGAGGDCQGAVLGGATVKYGFDMDEAACESFHLNHPSAKIHCLEAADYPPPGEDDSCDIFHLSPPCDYFSPNHTYAGRNDEANTRAMFYTYEKLMSAKPRVHTQENTFGLDSHHPEYFGTLIQEIVRAGYNIRWKVDQFAEHGLASSRKRVVIIAARIGVPIPEFPKASYGPPGSSLKRYRTIHDAISKIPDSASWHNHQRPYKIPQPTYDARTAMAKCITRNGGTTPHPSGLRPFTPREMANLQGFPEWYEFVGNGGTGITQVKKQIGNAIPPQVWAVYIRSIVDTLEKFDSGLIDETGRLIKTEEHVKREEAGHLSGFSTPFRKCIKPGTLSTPSGSNSTRTFSNSSSRFSDPFSTPSNPSSTFINTSTASSQPSLSNGSLYRMSPSPAPRNRKIRAFTENYLELSPEPTGRFKRGFSTFDTRPSPFKRKIDPIDLTGERKRAKAKMEDAIDLTEETKIGDNF
ncbi:S-adenosyl-L-methionine-dependent methyltransferase [Venturia nashicola]|nr:S-adenosyl-L-methionine-dependent methyltransferase [Venturia nashicola]